MDQNHENSYTVKRGKRWVNISGHTGKVLEPIWSFEKASYDTRQGATAAARRRSNTFGRAAETKRGRKG